jgi:phosphoglycerate dehydrogenase-like enzyme
MIVDLPESLPALEQAVVAFVLQPNERELFLPNLREERFTEAGAVCQWIDTSGLDAAAWERTLRELRPNVIVSAWSTPPIPLAWGLEPDCPLRCVCHVAGSVRKTVPRPLLERGLSVTNWGTSIAYTVAEHALLLAMALLRAQPTWRGAVETPVGLHRLMRSARTKSLRGRRVGVHGFGAIARELIAMLEPHRVDLRVYSAPVPPAAYAARDITPATGLEELFAHSEILFECEALTEATAESVTAPILARLPDDAVFVNVARARLVEEVALLAEARSGRLRIGLDVFHQEPLPTDSPWLRLPGVILSPHIAGPTFDAFQDCGDLALENVARTLAREPLLNLVTLPAYDAAT